MFLLVLLPYHAGTVIFCMVFRYVFASKMILICEIASWQLCLSKTNLLERKFWSFIVICNSNFTTSFFLSQFKVPAKQYKLESVPSPSQKRSSRKVHVSEHEG